ncbi:MAG: SIMPL domain-containing protein [Pseudomonadota bacterium]
MSLKKIALIASLALAAQAQAQQVPTTGTLVIVPANGEVTHVNDEATVNFMIEEQDKDKSAAASRVNQKMKQGTDIVRKEDPKATLKTLGYYTYPVYPEDRPLPNGMPSGKPRVATGWRVGQYLEVKTMNIGGLPKLTASVQKVLGLNGIQFGLSPATTKTLDAQRIAATYQNLNERIAAIAGAMGRKVSDATLDTVDFEGSGNYAGGPAADAGAPQMMRAMKAEAEVAEPSFEPGETTLQMRVVGKVRFK